MDKDLLEKMVSIVSDTVDTVGETAKRQEVILPAIGGLVGYQAGKPSRNELPYAVIGAVIGVYLAGNKKK